MDIDKIADWKRTSSCGDLRTCHIGREEILFGWINRQRDMGNLVFLDLRDRSGVVQVVVSSEDKALLERAKKCKMEYVLGIKGVVRARGEEARNPEMPTGEIEIEARELKVLNTSAVPPFVISDPPQAAEELRFKYRYLDLRRPSMQRNLKLRHQVMMTVRNYLAERGHLEIETPFLTKSTPEGARDYLVPSRMYKGRFFALPQSPQIFKQILMIAGVERYFQVVRCFRDEDLRADRQPEFTQIDIESSFVSRQDIFDLSEEMMTRLFALIGVSLETPFPRLTYRESMKMYGTDKPDLRMKMPLRDLSEAAAGIDSNVIQGILSSGGVLEALVLVGKGAWSRSRLDKLNQQAKDLGAKGLIWLKYGDEFKSNLKLQDAGFQCLWDALDCGKEDLVLMVGGDENRALKVLGEIRQAYIGEEIGDDSTFRFAWITEFPLFEWSEEEGRLVSVHHMFTSPLSEDEDLLGKDPSRARAQAYDLVLNGIEIGGGSIRIHDRLQQQRIFQILGMSEAAVEEKFGFFMEALRFGAPPHGGIALGLDRIVMLLAGESSIRDVIPFPKTTSSLCMLTNSPSTIEERQLRELGIKITQK